MTQTYSIGQPVVICGVETIVTARRLVGRTKPRFEYQGETGYQWFPASQVGPVSNVQH